MGAFEMKKGKVLPILCMVAIGLGVLLIYLLWRPDSDALMYAFRWTTPKEQSTRIASLADIVCQRIREYVMPGGNGRVFVHGLCSLLMGFRLYTLVKLLNTAMWCLFTWFVLRTGGLTREKTSLWGWAFGASVVWWVCWDRGTVIDAACAMNYVWTAVATLILFALWKRLKWWMVPFAFLFGWSQECFVLPALVALGGSMVVRSIVERRRAFTWQQAFAWLLILAGACFLCFGPASLGRAGHRFPPALRTVVREGAMLLIFLAPLPFLGMAILLWRKWWRRTSFRAFTASFLPSVEWWLYLLAATGMMLLSPGGGRAGTHRRALPLLVALLVLLARDRRWFSKIPCWLRKSWVLFVVLWVGVAVCFQYKATQMLQDCLARYRADPQGITSLPSIRAGVFKNSFWHANYDWCAVSFMLEFERTVPISFFAPWLYRSLYLNPAEYFAEAVPVPGTPCYMTPKAPRVLVAKGDVVPSEEESAVMEKQLQDNSRVSKLLPFVPGEIEESFSKRDDKRQWFATPRFVFTAKDGKVYTIFSGNKPEEWMK